MSSGQKPRTPRYFPRMKVRGARRKRLRTMYLFQRLGDASIKIVPNVDGFVRAMNRFIDTEQLIKQEYGRADGSDR